METALSLLAVAAAVVGISALAERIRFSAPLLLMLVGIGASFIPFIHEPELSSEIVLIGLLPPLLYAAAIRTSVVDFRANRRAIGYLSVLLVVVTTLGVALVTWLILGVPFPVAVRARRGRRPAGRGRSHLDRPRRRPATAAGVDLGGGVAGQRRDCDHLPATGSGGDRRHVRDRRCRRSVF